MRRTIGGRLISCVRCRCLYSTVNIASRTLNELLMARQNKYISPVQIPSTEQNVSLVPQNIKNTEMNIHQIITSLLGGQLSPDSPTFSILLNRLLTSKENVLYNRDTIELIFQVFQVYRDSMICKLTASQIYDFNLLCEYFIKVQCLRKAQSVMSYLLSQNIKSNTFLVKNYMKLKCGSDFLHQSKKYKLFETETTLNVIGKTLSSPGIKYWDEVIIQSLGYTKNIEVLNQFIDERWNIWDNRNANKKIIKGRDSSYPTGMLLSTIMLTYSELDKDMKRSIEIFKLFMRKYPSIKLNIVFWRQLIKQSIKFNNNEPNLQMTWSIMKSWYQNKERNKVDIPFDIIILENIIRCPSGKLNIALLEDIFKKCFVELIKKGEQDQISEREQKILMKYQTRIIKKFVDQFNYKRAFKLINKWSINETHKQELVNYFETRKIKKKIKMKPSSCKTYDDMIEEDMIMGRLW